MYVIKTHWMIIIVINISVIITNRRKFESQW
jgi:hypothetical protein